MNRDDIIRMAREAYGDWYPNAVPNELERFAALVAAAEREACAKVCEDTGIVHFEHCMVLHDDAALTLRNAAADIRARGQE